MYTPAKTINDLIKNSPHSELLKEVDELVSSKVDLERHLFDNGRTFSSIAFGRLGDTYQQNLDYADAGVINIASQKNYVALYIWSGGGGNGILDSHDDKLPKSSHNKGCLYIKSSEFLEEYRDVIVDILDEAVK